MNIANVAPELIAAALRDSLKDADPDGCFYESNDADTGVLITTIDGRFDLLSIAQTVALKLSWVAKS